MRKTVTQSSFNAGVMSPRLLGRTDFKKYDSAVETATNVVPLATGPICLRPGTQFITNALTNTDGVRLIPFKYNTTQAYMLEFTANKVRFFKDGGVVLSTRAFTNGTFTGSLTGWTTNNSGTGSATSVSDKAQISGGAAGVGAIYQQLDYLGVAQYTITANVTVGAITVKVGTTIGGSEVATGTLSVGTGSTFSFTPSTAQKTWYVQFSNAANTNATLDNVVLSTPEYIINSPYGESDLSKLYYAQQADVVYFALSSTTVPPNTLQRAGHDKWEFVDVTFIDGPYLDPNINTSITLQPSATSGAGVTITASGGNVFAATDVGRLLRLRTAASSSWGYAVITGYTSPTQVTVTVKSNFAGTTAYHEWRLGAFSQTTGYPGVVTFHEFRLVYANTPSNPNYVWFSEAQGVGASRVLWAPTEVTGTVIDSSSIYFPLIAGDVSSIFWMSSGNVLSVGTADSEWVIEAGDNSKALSPTNTRATRRTNTGSLQYVRPVRADGAVMYAKGTGTRVNRFLFNLNKDDYQSIDMTLLAEHLFIGKTIKEMVYAPERHSLVWLEFTDGSLAALTFIDAEEVGGWSSHTIAGSFSGGAAVVEAVAVIPASDKSYSEVWMVVKRTINGSQKKYIERLAIDFFGNSVEDSKCLDSHLTYSGSPTTTITGLGHLEGETVTILRDGAVHPSQVVTGGSITIKPAASKVTVGLPYTGVVETLDFDTPNAFGTTSLGQIRRITEAQLRMYETGLVKTGRKGQTSSETDLMEPRTAGSKMDTSTGLYTGVAEVESHGDFELTSGMRIEFYSPYPATLCSVMYKVIVNEG